MKTLIVLVCLVALATPALAGTVNMGTAQLAANGWTSFVQQASAGDTRGSVADSTGTPSYEGIPGIQFTADKVATGGSLVWASIGTHMMDSKTFNDITALTITTYGLEGDGSNWTAPTFVLDGQKSSTNVSNLSAVYLPWLNNPTTEGTTTMPSAKRPSPVQGWHTYNALAEGVWYVPSYGYYYSAAGFKAARGTLYFIPSPVASSGTGFNVGYGQQNTSGDPNWFSSARGEVSTFTVGINGVSTTYNLSPVPEPGTLVALLTGLVGLIGLRKRN